MNRSLIYLLIVFTCVFLNSCNNDANNKTKEYIEYWYNREIILPKDSTFRLYGRDIVNYDYSKYPFKVLILVGSTDCIGCKLNIDSWQRFIADMDSLSSTKLGFLFVLEPLYRREIYTILKSHEFSIPVCLDENREFRKDNAIENNESFIFLLDRENKVVCVGNPLVSSKIREIYKECIQ